MIGGFAAVFLTLAVINLLDAQEPVVWGTFTEEYCESTRRGCSSVGTWVSDDGRVTETDIRLDGWVEPGGSVRAGLRPSGIMDSGNDIVHAAGWIDIGPHVVPLAAALGTIIWGLMKALEWGHLRLPKYFVPERSSRH
ncbi:hypothetical protein ACFVTX_11325 [Agromyces sp. NPDC058136]|uniref:hypothetical protein n=1 Tax=Agromyces sp. NPDC058136 TaxID=3346354 RepID=UPI0036D7C1FC